MAFCVAVVRVREASFGYERQWQVVVWEGVDARIDVGGGQGRVKPRWSASMTDDRARFVSARVRMPRASKLSPSRLD
jgi:hypothetical protein